MEAKDTEGAQTLWVVGQLIGAWQGRNTIWDFQGVFSREELAEAACRTEQYFMYPILLNEEYPHEPEMPSSVRWPRREN